MMVGVRVSSDGKAVGLATILDQEQSFPSTLFVATQCQGCSPKKKWGTPETRL